MQSVNDIRSAFLDYFAKHGHAVVDSSPLVLPATGKRAMESALNCHRSAIQDGSWKLRTPGLRKPTPPQ